jgi:hypothetical protein
MHQALPKQVFLGDASETFHERYQQERYMADQTQQMQKRAQPKNIWHGGCLDTGAQKAVIGYDQAHAYCRWAGDKYKPRPSRNVFKFGQDVQKPQGIIGVRVLTPDNSFMLINVVKVKADVPLLIGLGTLDAFEMIVDTVENELRAPKAGWSVPIIRKFGHVYLEWKATDKFKRHEL